MTEKSRKQIAEKLKLTRRAKSLTQLELAEKAGISRNYYARLERAEVSPSAETLERVIKALGVKSSNILPF